MNRRACHLDAALKNLLVHVQPVKALSAEGRNQCRMNVDDPIRIRLYHLRRNRHKTPRKNYKIRSGSLKCRKKRIVKFLSGCETFGERT